MLPDYSETKRLFRRFFQMYAREKARAISPLAAVQTRYLHEGHAMKVARADQSESNSEVQQLSSEMAIKLEEIPDLTFEEAISKFDALILDIARKQPPRTRQKYTLRQAIGTSFRRCAGSMQAPMFRTL